jgi:DNA-directed RNA polymerase specialized sigma24 family protein
LPEQITGDRLAAEDIVAEAFVKTLDRRAEFLTLEQFKTFLYVSVRNRSYTFNSTEKPHRRIQLRVAADDVINPWPDRSLIKALQKAGAKNARYTEYPGLKI